MKALISPGEAFGFRWISSWSFENSDWHPSYSEVSDCERIAEVASSPFEVGPPLHWVDCPDDCVADQWYFKNGELKPKPQDEPKPEQPTGV